MQHFSFGKPEIDGLTIVKPFFSEDNRGYFLKSYEKEVFKENGIDTDIFEDFESFSKKGVIRGLHFQSINPQSKYIRVIQGEIFDVAVNIRKTSKTFGKWKGIYLSDKNKKALYISAGFAHGFLVLSETALVSYKCAGKFLNEYDTGIIWNDKDIGIDWPLHLVDNIIVSEKDSKLQSFNEYKKL